MDISPTGRVEPKQEVTITINADADAVVGYSGVDKSVELLADSNDITAQKVIQTSKRN